MKLTQESINNINVFESLTGARVRDCFSDSGKLVFLIEEGNVKIALGKNNSNVYRVSKILKKEIKIIAFSGDVCKFVSNLIYPNKADEIKFENNVVSIFVSDTTIKGRIFGRGRENLKRINSIVKNYFKVDEVMVV